MENLPSLVYILGLLITAGAGVLGTRYFADKAQAKREDKREIDALQKENHGKEIDADVLTLKLLIDRIKSLEEQAVIDRKDWNTRYDRLNERIAEEIKNSARLTAAVESRDNQIALLRKDIELLRAGQVAQQETQKGNQRIIDMPEEVVIPEIVKVQIVEGE